MIETDTDRSETKPDSEGHRADRQFPRTGTFSTTLSRDIESGSPPTQHHITNMHKVCTKRPTTAMAGLA